MASIGVYAGSFDPPTLGHVWMIEHGAKLFDQLVVAIGVNAMKKPVYTVRQREEWLKSIVGKLPRVRINSFGNMFLVDYARQIGATHMLRGIRNQADFAYEQTMRHVNADMQPAIDTVFLMPPREISEVSSSLVRSVVGPTGWQGVVKKYVPEEVYDDLVRLHGEQVDGAP
ncbi:MAG: pantetheine-phosphate adenylyltransferase [Phycisphaerales bacterium]|nr:pantetheine-phosphate adenylyltransferase [Phycisphaerales bacterium]